MVAYEEKTQRYIAFPPMKLWCVVYIIVFFLFVYSVHVFCLFFVSYRLAGCIRCVCSLFACMSSHLYTKFPVESQSVLYTTNFVVMIRLRLFWSALRSIMFGVMLLLLVFESFSLRFKWFYQRPWKFFMFALLVKRLYACLVCGFRKIVSWGLIESTERKKTFLLFIHYLRSFSHAWQIMHGRNSIKLINFLRWYECHMINMHVIKIGCDVCGFIISRLNTFFMANIKSDFFLLFFLFCIWLMWK